MDDATRARIYALRAHLAFAIELLREAGAESQAAFVQTCLDNDGKVDGLRRRITDAG